MGSVSNSNPWAPNSVFKDCSQGICSIYCPQWCYIVYSPPPPSVLLGDNADDHPSGFEFSPLIVAVIGILASTFILVTYYTVISRFCRHRGRFNDPGSQTDHEVSDAMNNESAQVSSSSGLDEAQIKSITVCKYVKGSGLVEGTDCSVCLSEFQENESLRLLPKCNHAFHLPCIDTWLKSHSSCPLCRSNISSTTDSSPNQRHAAVMEAPASININSLEYQQRSDVVIIQSPHPSSRQEVVVDFGGGEVQEKWPMEEANDGQNTEQTDRHELNESQRRSIADILDQSDADV